ncbi:MAG: hypothetical protein HZA74_04885 [Ignavibacteriales bacterium]|nr:hypothetical protein [Ignavibacteriales bacterium]
MTKEEIEQIFQNSDSSDELFDAFAFSLKLGISDFEFYKPLLGNRALSSDEIKMFAEKLAKEMKNQAIDIYLWTGNLFIGISLEDSFNYYYKAFFIDPTNYLPLSMMINLINYDYDDPFNKIILEFVESNVVSVHKKSEIYYSLSKHYKKINDLKNAAKYLALAEKASERESE